MSDRPAGFYWVRAKDGRMLVAEWAAAPVWNCWWAPGNEVTVDDDVFEVVSGPIEPPPTP